MDRLSSTQRSLNMAAIKGKNTRPEIFVRKLLFSRGYRYRLFDKKLPGRPDLVLKKFNTVIFVHGCFWHSHDNCPKARVPETNRTFWLKKLKANRLRDQKINKELITEGYKVLIIWQCACLKKHSERLLNKIITFLNSDDRYQEIGRQELLELPEKEI